MKIELSKAEFVALLMEHGKTVIGAHRAEGLLDTSLEASLKSAGIQTEITASLIDELGFNPDDQVELAEKIKILKDMN